MHIDVRIDKQLHEKAKAKAAKHGGLSAVVRQALSDFVNGIQSVEPELFTASPTPSAKESRFSIRLDDALHKRASLMANRYGGLSALIRCILVKYAQR